QGTFGIWQNASVLGHFPDLPVQIFHRINRIDQLPQRSAVMPQVTQARQHRRPLANEGGMGAIEELSHPLKGHFGLLVGGRLIDPLQFPGNALALGPGHTPQTASHDVNHARLESCLRIDTQDGVFEPSQLIGAEYQDVLQAAFFQFHEDLMPERGRLRWTVTLRRHVEAQDLHHAGFSISADLVGGRRANAALVAHLEMDGINKHNGVDALQRTAAPLGQHRIQPLDNSRDKHLAGLKAVELPYMALDLSRGHSRRIHGDDAVLDLVSDRSILRHDLRLEGAVAVARNANLRLAVTLLPAFAASAVARVTTALWHLFGARFQALVRCITKVLAHLFLQRNLHKAADELLQWRTIRQAFRERLSSTLLRNLTQVYFQRVRGIDLLAPTPSLGFFVLVHP